MRLCGINSRFQLVSPGMRQVSHALLTRPPLTLKLFIRRIRKSKLVRLACVKHAASVHPEPGSNSRIKFDSGSGYITDISLSLFTVFKGSVPLKLKKNFQGCFTVQLSRIFAAELSVFQRQLDYYIARLSICQQLFYISCYQMKPGDKRRKRDLNPRAGFNPDLHP